MIITKMKKKKSIKKENGYEQREKDGTSGYFVCDGCVFNDQYYTRAY